jgi:hypothetical protein
MTQEIPVLTVLSSSQPDPKNPRAPWWTWERRLSRRSLRKASYLEGFAVFGEFHLEVWWILVINCKWTLFAELGGHLRPCYMKSQSWGLAVLLINGLIQAPFLPLNRIFRVQRDIGFQLPTHQTIEITYNYWYYIYISHYDRPQDLNVRPKWHSISHFSHGFNTCFIHGSNRLAGMDGTLGVAGPSQCVRHKICFMARFTTICGNNPSQTSWGSVKKKDRFVQEITGSEQTSGSVRNNKF